MAFTEELREALTQRGIEWETSEDRYCENDVTRWRIGLLEWTAFESERGFFLNAGMSGYTALSVDEVLKTTIW